MTKFKIFVKTLQNNILKFSVDNYKVEDGFVKFFDARTNENKSFACSNCEIYDGGASNGY